MLFIPVIKTEFSSSLLQSL